MRAGQEELPFSDSAARDYVEHNKEHFHHTPVSRHIAGSPAPLRVARSPVTFLVRHMLDTWSTVGVPLREHGRPGIVLLSRSSHSGRSELTCVSVGCDTNQSFRVRKVNLATLKVAAPKGRKKKLVVVVVSRRGGPKTPPAL